MVEFTNIVEGYDGCAVEVHDRQGDGVGRTSVRAWETVQVVGTQIKPRRRHLN